MGNWNSVPAEEAKPPPNPLTNVPWRDQEFSEREKNKLLERIRNYSSLTESVEPKILLIGICGCGKSSFFNSVNSIFRGHVTFQAAAGPGDTVITRQLREYRVYDGKGGKCLPFILCDTQGLEFGYENGIDVDYIISIIKGHVQNMYEFNPWAPIKRGDEHYREEPSLADKVHCVVYVVEADTISIMDQTLLRRFQAIQSEVNKMGIPLVILVTMIDKSCSEVHKDLTKVYQSRYLYERVIQLGRMLGVPVSVISLVKNYSIEVDLNQNVDILILKALQMMLTAADVYLDDLKLRGLTG